MPRHDYVSAYDAASADVGEGEDGRPRLVKLRRAWGRGGALGFVFLNPGPGVGPTTDDAEIVRAVALARRLGCGSIEVGFLFGLIGAKLAELREQRPIVPREIFEAVRYSAGVVCAWGDGGAIHGAGVAARGELVAGGCTLGHLGLTRKGHPVRLRDAAEGVVPRRFESPATARV